MKVLKRIAVMILFVVAVVALLVPLSYAVRPLDQQNKGTRNRITGFYAEQEDSLNVVIVGSSAIYRFINNVHIYENEDITSYNFATASLSVFLIEDVIDEILKTQSPELLVIDIRQYFKTNDDVIDEKPTQYLYNNMKYSGTRIKMVNRLYRDLNVIERIPYYFDIALYHDNWDQILKYGTEYMTNEREHPMKGVQIVDQVKAFDQVNVEHVTEEKAISEAAEEALRALLEKCKNENIQVMFLCTPYKVSENRQMESNYARRIVESYGFDYLDMNLVIDDIGLDFATDFYDSDHVNVWGSDKVSAYLGDYLSENYEFDTEHEEEVVQSWEAAIQAYNDRRAFRLGEE